MNQVLSTNFFSLKFKKKVSPLAIYLQIWIVKYLLLGTTFANAFLSHYVVKMLLQCPANGE